MILANDWSPEQWATLVTSILASVGAMAAGIIAAWKSNSVHAEIKPPSNGATAGALLEAIGQVQHMQVTTLNPDSEVPPAMKVARDIQWQSNIVPDPPARRDTDPPAVTNG